MMTLKDLENIATIVLDTSGSSVIGEPVLVCSNSQEWLRLARNCPERY